MSFFKNLFGGSHLDGAALAHSQALKEYAQVDLLARFDPARALHDVSEQQRWSRVLPKPYMDTVAQFLKISWLEQAPDGSYRVTAVAMPFVTAYRQRLMQERELAQQQVRDALDSRMTSEALTIRRQYENRLPLGQAEWTGPEPQMSHSSVTRQIFFLDHWMLDGLSEETVTWLKRYAAEEHLWGAHWMPPASTVPQSVQRELAQPGTLDGVEGAYWKAYQMGLFVDNQETWRRCKGGDHVRRIEIAGPDDAYTCPVCQEALGKQFLVARVPELPHKACTSPRGCRCRYEPVLETIEEIPLMG